MSIGKDKHMRFLVVGAGSTGGYFGGRLAQAGRDVTFLVRPRRAEQLRATGLQIVSPHGDITLTPKLVTADAIRGPFDVVLLTVKGFSLEAALNDLAPAIGPQTMILSVLNGMKHIDLLTDRFGAQAVVGCVCKVSTTLDEQGRILQLHQMQDISYGELDGSSSERTQRLDAAMQGAGFDARLSPHIAREMWEKWTLLATMGGICCLMRGNIGDIARAAGGRDFVLGFIDEVATVITAVGEKPSDKFLATMRELLTQSDSMLASSMYRDLESNQPVEVEQIIGDLLERGRAAKVPMPRLAAAYTNLSLYQNKRLCRGKAKAA
jgi:2-dehydropantoate 2-reductase